MEKRLVAILIFLVFASIILPLVAAVKMSQSELDRSLHSELSSYRFSLFRWEAEHLWSHFISRSSLSDKEKVLKDQITKELRAEGIGGWIFFPPLSFEIESPPELLVISPRESIEVKRSVLLLPKQNENTRNEIENKADSLNVSSLVVGTGGLAAYPSLIQESDSLRWTLQTIVHEWMHHYLFFKPLGFHYALQFSGKRNYELATINETVANMAGKEIGDLVYYKYYGERPNEDFSPPNNSEYLPSEFDLIMREIRKKVDQLLALGRVEEAENYMREQRDFLESKGYYIRKLNQAYFAFYGAYADSPVSSSVDPIGEKLEQLRESSSSLKEFLRKVQNVRNVEELNRIETAQ